MAEYYALLNRAIGGLKTNTEPTRRAVYDKARSALVAQLKAIQPPLSAAEISRQRLELEEAVRRVEREVTATRPADSDDVSRSAALAMEAALSAEPDYAPVRQNPAPPRPAPQQQRPAQPRPAAPPPRPEMHQPEPPPPPAVEEPEDIEPDAWESGGTTETYAEPEIIEPAPPAPRPANPFSRRPMASAQPSALRPAAAPQPAALRAAAPQAAPQPTAYVAPMPELEAPEAPDHSLDDATVAALADDPPRQSRRERRAERAALKAERQEAKAGRRRRRSFLSTFLAIILAFAVLGGMAFAAWIYREELMEFIGSIGSGTPTEETAQPVQPIGPATDVRVVGGAPAQANAGQPTQVAQTPAPPDPAAAAVPAVAERAVLFEEPVGGAGEIATVAAEVTWRVLPDPAGPLIAARIDVPERNLRIEVSIQRETGNALYSHSLDVFLPAPEAFPGGGLRQIPRIMVKATEEAAGEALIGTPEAVPPDYFWIGLARTDVGANVAALRTQEWFDLPIIYGNDQRAILTFAKGESGRAVFAEVLAAWGE